MRVRLGLALFVTVILIGGATWIRFAKASPTPAKLAVITTDDNGAQENNANQNQPTENSADLAAATTTSATSTADLTETDLIGRQLISDYMNMESTGEATPDNLTALAGTYADNIASLNVSTNITAADLTVVPDSQTNLQAYADAFVATYLKYQKLMDTVLGDNPDLSTLGPGLTSFASNMQELYQREADELKSIPVPTSISDDEVKLINNYLSTAAAMKALSNVNTDPASSFAGIVAQQQNNADEKNILSDIGNILDADGIIPRTP